MQVKKKPDCLGHFLFSRFRTVQCVKNCYPIVETRLSCHVRSAVWLSVTLKIPLLESETLCIYILDLYYKSLILESCVERQPGRSTPSAGHRIDYVRLDYTIIH